MDGFNWALWLPVILALAVLVYALFKKVKDIAGVASETKEAVDVIIHALSEASEGGKKITADEFAKILKELGDVLKKFKGENGE